MAENKKGFILYADLIHTIEKMPIEKAGELFLHILNYVNDKNPVSEDLIINLTFEPIKQQLKRDLKHWESIRIKRSDAGKASAIKRQQMSTSVESVEQDSTNPTVIVNVNDNVIVNKEVDKFNFLMSLVKYGFDTRMSKEWMLVRKNKKATNTETAFNNFISQVEKSKLDKNVVLKMCVEKSWSGFNADWVKSDKTETVKNSQRLYEGLA